MLFTDIDYIPLSSLLYQKPQLKTQCFTLQVPTPEPITEHTPEPITEHKGPRTSHAAAESAPLQVLYELGRHNTPGK